MSKLQQLEEMLTASGGGGKRQSSKFQATIPAAGMFGKRFLSTVECVTLYFMIFLGTNSDYKDSQPCTVGWDFQEQEVKKLYL